MATFRYHSRQVRALDIDDENYSESEVCSTEYYVRISFMAYFFEQV